MKKILEKLSAYQTLSKNEAKEILINIAEGKYNEYEVTAFTTLYFIRTPTIEEIKGFRESLLELCISVPTEETFTLDIVGTGGDGKNTFNISTLACLVCAGAGAKITKHGNYAASSVSGSSNILENFGYKFSTNIQKINCELREAGITFLHAPLFHPALKTVATMRKSIKVRTFFNFLGPLVNPSFPTHSFIGVYNLDTLRRYHYILQEEPMHYLIIHGIDGYDEISLTDDTKLVSKKGEFVYTPNDFLKNKVHPDDLSIQKNVEDATFIFKNVLENKATENQKNVVLVNAAMSLYAYEMYPNYADALMAATESLESGKALMCFKKLIDISQK